MMKSKMMAAGGAMPMKMKDGKEVPAFLKNGGMSKMMASGGMHKMPDGKMMKDSDMKKMAKGGMAHKDVKMDKGMMQKAVNKHEGRLHKGSSMTKLAKGGGIETKGKTKGKMIAMRNGGKC
jgi:hypothetical protein